MTNTPTPRGPGTPVSPPRRRLRRGLPSLRSYHFFPWHWFVNVFLASPLVPRRYVARLFRLAGFDLRGLVVIRPGVFFATSDVVMEDDSGLEPGCRLISHGGIHIGRRTGISYGVLLITQTHEIGGPERRWSHPARTAPIMIGDGVWVGAGAIVLPGVVIGDGCVIAAGAVVGRDCEPNGLYFGNPARRIEDLPMD